MTSPSRRGCLLSSIVCLVILFILVLPDVWIWQFMNPDDEASVLGRRSAIRESGPPNVFHKGDDVTLQVNKLTSDRTPFTVDYYAFPFCQPEGGPETARTHLGQRLEGDVIYSSPYHLRFQQDMYCQQLCISNLGRAEQRHVSPNRLAHAIHMNYHHNWILDNLPSASKTEDDFYMTTVFAQGFPVGMLGDSGLSYIHNHVNIEVVYHRVNHEDSNDGYHIVQFIVEPFSIAHRFNQLDERNAETGQVAQIINGIQSCNTKSYSQIHTNYDNVMMTSPQLASGRVLFTYDVIWREDVNLRWTHRWDAYLNTRNRSAARFRVFATFRKLIILVLCASFMVCSTSRYFGKCRQRCWRIVTCCRNQPVGQTETEEERDAWKLLHGHVFRPPSTSPLLLAVVCGTGAQLLASTLAILLLASLRLFKMNPSERGRYLSASIVVYPLLAPVGGYITASLYKVFNGTERHLAVLATALGFPSFCAVVLVFLNVTAISQNSSLAVHFQDCVLLVALWFGLNTILVVVGARFGYVQDFVQFSTTQSDSEREIPKLPCRLRPFVTVPLCGAIPCGMSIIELHMVLNAVWQDQVYFVYGYLLLVALLTIVGSVMIVIFFNYVRLCRENYRWWWNTFLTGGAISAWIFLYSIFYFKCDLDTDQVAVRLYYYVSILCVCLAIFLMFGFAGLWASLCFNQWLYAGVKVETGVYELIDSSDVLEEDNVETSCLMAESHNPVLGEAPATVA